MPQAAERKIKARGGIIQWKLNNVLRAYFAGLLDGEGSICIIKAMRNNKMRYKIPVYSVAIAISNTNLLPLEIAKQAFGGIVYEDKKQYNLHLGKKICSKWQITTNKAGDFLKQVYPFLIIKQPEAKIALSFLKNKKRISNLGSNQFKKRIFPQEEIDKREGFYQQLRIIKHDLERVPVEVV